MKQLRKVLDEENVFFVAALFFPDEAVRIMRAARSQPVFAMSALSALGSDDVPPSLGSLSTGNRIAQSA